MDDRQLSKVHPPDQPEVFHSGLGVFHPSEVQVGLNLARWYRLRAYLVPVTTTAQQAESIEVLDAVAPGRWFGTDRWVGDAVVLLVRLEDERPYGTAPSGFPLKVGRQPFPCSTSSLAR